jgi:(1->4)-alpha-D-glucan 1-alpha-D-glucosylmutase
MTNGRAKLFLTHRALLARKEKIAIFSRGTYIPLEATGELSNHVVAFARGFEGEMAVAIAPRLLAGVVKPGDLPLAHRIWKGTEISLPGGASSGWRDAITGCELATEGTMQLGDALKHFPVALLLSEEGNRQ